MASFAIMFYLDKEVGIANISPILILAKYLNTIFHIGSTIISPFFIRVVKNLIIIIQWPMVLLDNNNYKEDIENGIEHINKNKVNNKPSDLDCPFSTELCSGADFNIKSYMSDKSNLFSDLAKVKINEECFLLEDFCKTNIEIMDTTFHEIEKDSFNDVILSSRQEKNKEYATKVSHKKRMNTKK